MSEREHVVGTLYVVATPIGHLGDLTRRAEDVLKAVQIVAAEDTRRTSVLLGHLGVRVPELLSYHEHNKAKLTGVLLARLLAGDDIAVVSDAGTPLINDPGAELVAAAHSAGVPTVPIPGASAVTAALSVCPFPCYTFRYIGFLPAKKSARRKSLQAALAGSDALVFFEAPHRIAETIKDLAACTERRVLVARELTKKFETLTVAPANELDGVAIEPRGEFVLIVEAGKEVEQASVDMDRAMRVLLTHLSPSQAAKCAATLFEQKKSAMYELALRLNESE
ncbi:MAG: 16S rRNA (cytidine(1402)-2'-O)-methyltransferase [Pseudomonadales bacterium]|nr:16S rRNA (cytidine(1402)-2'-O)-methyltransferase [Pseudomonadales bacterium]